MGGGAHPSGARRSDDVLPAEQAYGLGGFRSPLAEGDDAGAVLRSTFQEEFISLGLDTGGNTVAEILDNRGYFSLPYLK